MSALTEIHNYYAPLVEQYLQVAIESSKATIEEGFIADITCIALNQLPSKYVRHDVDTTFFLSDTEQSRMHKQVKDAVKYALYIVQQDSSEDTKLRPPGSNPPQEVSA